MTQSLHGLRILNTRPKAQAQMLSKSIIDAGGLVIECPTLQITATDQHWLDLIPDLRLVDQAIFISANAVHFCFRLLREKKINWPAQIKVIAIGYGSARALHDHAITVNEVPELPDSEHLLALKTIQSLKNQTVLLFKGEGGRTLIEDTLVQRGATLLKLLVYQRGVPKTGHQFIESIWRDDLVDMILITSEQSLINLFHIFGKAAHNWLQSKACLVISDRLADSAALFGMSRIIISHPQQMMKTLFDYAAQSINKGLSHGQEQ
ncbi:MAG: uroporphyrinogen-III synthase [Legionellales bacterium]